MNAILVLTLFVFQFVTYVVGQLNACVTYSCPSQRTRVVDESILCPVLENSVCVPNDPSNSITCCPEEILEINNTIDQSDNWIPVIVTCVIGFGLLILSLFTCFWAWLVIRNDEDNEKNAIKRITGEFIDFEERSLQNNPSTLFLTRSRRESMWMSHPNLRSSPSLLRSTRTGLRSSAYFSQHHQDTQDEIEMELRLKKRIAEGLGFILEGLEVDEVADGSPADEAGMKPGMTIEKICGKHVTEDSINKLIRQAPDRGYFPIIVSYLHPVPYPGNGRGGEGMGSRRSSRVGGDGFSNLQDHPIVRRRITKDKDGLVGMNAQGTLITGLKPYGPALEAGVANGWRLFAIDGEKAEDATVPAMIKRAGDSFLADFITS